MVSLELYKGLSAILSQNDSSDLSQRGLVLGLVSFKTQCYN